MENLPSQSSNGRNTKARKKVLPLQEAEESPFACLCRESEQINPAIILAEKLMRKNLGAAFDDEDLRQAEETINASRKEIERVGSQFAALVKSPAFAGEQIPVGF